MTNESKSVEGESSMQTKLTLVGRATHEGLSYRVYTRKDGKVYVQGYLVSSEQTGSPCASGMASVHISTDTLNAIGGMEPEIDDEDGGSIWEMEGYLLTQEEKSMLPAPPNGCLVIRVPEWLVQSLRPCDQSRGV